MSMRKDRLAVVLLGLLAGCEKDAQKIEAEPASSAAQADEDSTKSDAKPAASVGASEVAPPASGSAKAGTCAPGGCAPGKCGR